MMSRAFLFFFLFPLKSQIHTHTYTDIHTQSGLLKLRWIENIFILKYCLSIVPLSLSISLFILFFMVFECPLHLVSCCDNWMKKCFFFEMFLLLLLPPLLLLLLMMNFFSFFRFEFWINPNVTELVLNIRERKRRTESISELISKVFNCNIMSMIWYFADVFTRYYNDCVSYTRKWILSYYVFFYF